MKVFLYNPPVQRGRDRRDDVVNTPLPSCLMTGYAASSLMACGQDVRIVESRDSLVKQRNSFVAMHLVYQWEKTDDLLRPLASLKKDGAIRSLYVFGLFPTAAYEEVLRRYPFIDGVIVGEPEISLPALVSKAHGATPRTAVPGVAFRERGQTHFTPRPPVRDLDRLPFPLRTGLIQGTAYVLGSRGCYGRCSFCTIHSLYGHGTGWRGRSPENIIEEMVQIRKEHGDPYFYFADSNFFGPGRRGKERGRKLAGLIRQGLPDVRFGMECRADNVEERLFSELQDAGLKEVFLGVENFTEPGLRRFNKGLTPRENIRAVKTLQQLGLSLSLGFILFDQEATLEEIRTNVETLRELGLLSFPSNTAHLLSHRVFHLRGSSLFRETPRAEFERDYKFTDPEVGRLYDMVLPACKEVLRHVNGEDFRGAQTASHAALNDRLIRDFEEALCSLEGKGRQRGDRPLMPSEVSCGG